MDDINFKPNKSKVSQLVDSIRLAISQGIYSDGDVLPSIRKISTEYNLSRDTVYKAFQELKDKGIVESTPSKGYFVANTCNNVFVLLDVFRSYKESLYHSMISSLPKNFKVDLYFHHYNERSFNNLILDSIGRYDLYVIMNLSNDKYYEVLDRLDNSKVLILDFGGFKKDKFSYICQEFDNSLYDCLVSGYDYFKKYNELCFILNDKTEHPKSCAAYFEKFCKENKFEYSILTEDVRDIHVRPNVAYIASQHKDMIDVIKICRDKELVVGKDIGLVAFNDAPMLEVIEGGISVISTDFKLMGNLVAEFIKTRNNVQTYVPTKLTQRMSL